MSKRALTIIVAAIVLCAIASHLAGRMHWDKVWLVFGGLAVVPAGWALLGHLVTLDDDAPAGFSNPDASPSVWRTSLIELLAKGLLFAFVAIAVMSGPS
jgi:hypothetical protein